MEINACVEHLGPKRWNKTFQLTNIPSPKTSPVARLFFPWDYDVPDAWLDVIRFHMPKPGSQWIWRKFRSREFTCVFHVEHVDLLDLSLQWDEFPEADKELRTLVIEPMLASKKQRLRLIGLSNL